jgi:hypothetical protein
MSLCYLTLALEEDTHAGMIGLEVKIIGVKFIE